MSDFRDSAWSDSEFAGNFLDRADIYVPERRKMFRIVSSLFSYFNTGKTVSLLDLGCGDGILTQELLSTGSAVSATLVDGNEGMLQKARERLTACTDLNFIKASFQEILGGSVKLWNYDMCVSSMAIHHLEMDEKAALFRLISEHLVPGGHFVNIDVVRPPSTELEDWYFENWKDWMAHMMGRLNITDEAPEDVVKRYQTPATGNRPDTLAAQIKALEEAGFIDAECYYKDGIFVVFGGRKPA